MLSELLLVLGGHPSSLFTPSGPSPSLAAYLHPGEVSSLSTLCALAADYTLVRTWTESTQAKARAGVLAASRKGKGKAVEEGLGQYVAVLAGAIRELLGEYDELLIETEAKVLSLDPGTVQPLPPSSGPSESSANDPTTSGGGAGYVPLSLLLATFDAWSAPLSALASLVTSLEASPLTPGELMTRLSDLSATGNPSLRRVFTTLSQRLWRLWLTHLVVFLLDGVAPDTSTPSSPALGLDAGADPPHRLYRLNPDLLPRSVGRGTRESILYVGRVAATLQREGKALPRSLVERTRADVLASTPLGLDAAVQRARSEIGEWLWTHILTGAQVADALESFADYFLTRDGEYALNVLSEISRLRQRLLGDPTSSSSIVRAHDLDLALLRASLGTSAENDRFLETLSWSMPLGPLRAHTSHTVEDDGSVRALFAPALLGTPLALTAAVKWPLDLFLTPNAVAAYADMHAYLIAIRDTHVRVLECWTSLSGAQRRRRQYTGIDEGGAGEEREARVHLARKAWGTVRAMLFFLDELLGHFMQDIVGVHHRRLLAQLRDPAPTTATGKSSAGGKAGGNGGGRGHDFLTLRQMHARHLAFLREGLFLSEREPAQLVRDVLDTCKRFAGLVERWGGDVLPELLVDDAQLGERAQAVQNVADTLHEQIGDFFRLLLESQTPTAQDQGQNSATATRASLSRASLSRARVTQIMAAGGQRTDAEGEGLMSQHVEQLLLRLDFNGVLTLWLERGADEAVLPPRDLQ